MKSELKSLPSVNKILETRSAAELIARYGRPLFLNACNKTLDDIRGKTISDSIPIPSKEKIISLVEEQLKVWVNTTLLPVINATGVILHTNLGRAPLSNNTIKSMQAAGMGYSNLEFNLKTGKRGSRFLHTKELLCKLTGAEDAIVVNNNASSLLLILSALANRRKVLISRTQLIEIGGGFRIPDIMKQSGATMIEIGATNRVHISDYKKALNDYPIKMVLRAHRSNFKLVGFVGDPPFAKIAEISKAASAIVVDDLGSGTLLNTEKFGISHETTIQESLQSGADLVCFSGDKLLGGPQAGIIVGKAEYIKKLKKHQISRAVRADKTTLAGLSATLLHYLTDEAEREIPIWQMISNTPEILKHRVLYWQKTLGVGEIIEGCSTVGGGSLPGQEIPTTLLAIKPKSANSMLAKLREARPPIIARIDNGKIVFDPRTVLPEQEGSFLLGVKQLLNK
jgi:L-seryl-tRNA(Ser) seleniumtransferase